MLPAHPICCVCSPWPYNTLPTEKSRVAFLVVSSHTSLLSSIQLHLSIFSPHQSLLAFQEAGFRRLSKQFIIILGEDTRKGERKRRLWPRLWRLRLTTDTAARAIILVSLKSCWSFRSWVNGKLLSKSPHIVLLDSLLLLLLLLSSSIESCQRIGNWHVT